LQKKKKKQEKALKLSEAFLNFFALAGDKTKNINDTTCFWEALDGF
jgi:hypothetical protein